jgi:hypothetical protein
VGFDFTPDFDDALLDSGYLRTTLGLLVLCLSHRPDFEAIWLVLLIDCFLLQNLLVFDKHQIRQQRVVETDWRLLRGHRWVSGLSGNPG